MDDHHNTILILEIARNKGHVEKCSMIACRSTSAFCVFHYVEHKGAGWHFHACEKHLLDVIGLHVKTILDVENFPEASERIDKRLDQG